MAIQYPRCGQTEREREREGDDKSGEWETIHFLSGHGPHTTSLYTSRTLIFCLWRVYTHAERIGYFSCMSSHMLLLHTDAYKHKEPLSSSCCCRRRRFAILELAWSSRFDFTALSSSRLAIDPPGYLCVSVYFSQIAGKVISIRIEFL